MAFNGRRWELNCCKCKKVWTALDKKESCPDCGTKHNILVKRLL